jgi:integral membrane sensor domain MASE1/signal transduction histidine kinase
MKPTDATAQGKELARIFVVAAVYLVTAKAGLLLAIPHTNATAIWPATGIALGAVLLLGYRIWPAIAIGAFLADLWHLSSIGFSLQISLAAAFSTTIGNTLEALLGAWLIRSCVGERNPLVRLDDIVRFVVFGALGASIVSASIGVSTLCAISGTWANFGVIWLTWWLGDASGALVLTPVMLTWSLRQRKWPTRKIAEGGLLLLLLLVLGWCYFLEPHLRYMFIPLLVWASMRFGPCESAVVILLVAIVSIVGIADGIAFDQATLNAPLLLLQGFISVVSVTTMFLSSSISQRKQAEGDLLTANEELRAVNRFIAISTGTQAPQVMLDRFLAEALLIVGLEGGTVCTVEPDDTLKMIAQREASEATISDLTSNRIKVGECLCGNCAHDNCPLILPDRQAVLGYASREAQRRETINFHAAFPFTVKGKCVGVLCVFTRTDKKPGPRSLKLLETLTAQVALAVENAQYLEKLQQNSDELETRVAARTAELVVSRAELEAQNEDLQNTYRQLEEETSERLSAQEELREKALLIIQQSRLAAMGEMIGNIAHQWRQPLNMLGLLIQELAMTYKRGEFNTAYLEECVKKVLQTIHQMSKTIDDFRNFFKPEKERTDFRVLEVMERTISLLEASLHANQITIAVVKGCDPVVNGYPNEFSQVLLNIMINARDAFVARQVASPTITIKTFSEAGRCIMTITDNAGGIPEGIIGKIFEPYFTTKGPDKGTGVGLYMSKVIIEKNMGGRLTVRNVGDGAEFRIEV